MNKLHGIPRRRFSPCKLFARCGAEQVAARCCPAAMQPCASLELLSFAALRQLCMHAPRGPGYHIALTCCCPRDFYSSMQHGARHSCCGRTTNGSRMFNLAASGCYNHVACLLEAINKARIHMCLNPCCDRPMTLHVRARLRQFDKSGAVCRRLLKP